jgi:hypothetical protein
MSLSSHVDDGAAESYWRWHCRGDVGRGVMSLPSHGSDGVAQSMLVVALRHC